MNREIKFRGIRIDNSKFVHGSLLIEEVESRDLRVSQMGEFYQKTEYTSYSIRAEETTSDGKVWCQVDPATVGQYIGKQDNNGIEVFEGDILQRYKKNGAPYKNVKEVPSIEHVNTSNIDFNECVVVGNIHTGLYKKLTNE